eukprot:8685362-Heterocapsa_arctica.AAC.1
MDRPPSRLRSQTQVAFAPVSRTPRAPRLRSCSSIDLIKAANIGSMSTCIHKLTYMVLLGARRDRVEAGSSEQ